MAVLFERRLPQGRVYVCDAGPVGTIGVPEDPPPTRGAPVGERPTVAVLPMRGGGLPA